MSRLDRHVTLVQNKLALTRFLYGLAWALLVFGAIVWVGIIVDRLLHVRLPHPIIWFWSGVAASFLAALIYAIINRPTPEAAATIIDQRLSLKEKFSTALYVRPLNDPFAQAAVRDAEQTADNVSLAKRFPVQFPLTGLVTTAVIIAAFLTFILLPSLDLFHREQAKRQQELAQQKTEDARKVVQAALARVNATPKDAVDSEILKRARHDLTNLLNQPVRDPEQTKRSAAKALQDVGEAIKQQMVTSQRFADAQSDAKAFKSLMPTDDEKGPVADAQRAIAKGDFSKAVDELEKTAEKFEQMSDEQKQQAAAQMQKMAQQLQQMAQNPQVQQQLQQQLQQMGASPQQAQQMAQQIQQAAQGDKQAQQNLQQQAQAMMKQMNNGQGPTPQQKQQMQQAMAQMQAMANSQAQAQQMAQAAQNMSQAMKQQAQAKQPGAQGQTASQQMAQNKQAMTQQLQAMQAMKADAQQVVAAQQAAQQAAQDAAGACAGGNNGQGQPAGQGNQPWAGNNPGWRPGQNNNGNPKPNQGMQGGGIGAGPRDFKEEAPYAVKQEISPSDDIEGGKILASTLVKAKSEKGKSTVGLQDVIQKGEKEATDEVEQERVGREAQQAVKEYFRSVTDDADKPGAAGAAQQPVPPAQPQQ